MALYFKGKAVLIDCYPPEHMPPYHHHHPTMYEKHRKSHIQHIVSEANYVHILSGQKFIRNAQFGEFFKNVKLAVKQCYQAGQI